MNDGNLKKKELLKDASAKHQHEEILKAADEEIHDETDAEGSMPEPEGYNTLDEAQEMGLYEEADDEHLVELDLAGQVMKDEKKQWSK